METNVKYIVSAFNGSRTIDPVIAVAASDIMSAIDNFENLMYCSECPKITLVDMIECVVLREFNRKYDDGNVLHEDWHDGSIADAVLEYHMMLRAKR